MIGILAGMGPKSTAPFVDQVISFFQEITFAKNDIDFPPMMIYSLPTPFYIDRPINHALMEKTISQGLKKLESCGVSFIAMPCNTAHLYYETLQKSIQIPLLDMIKITLDSLPICKKIAILATQQTIDSQIYQKKLKERNQGYLQHPEWQEKINTLIKSIKEERDLKKAEIIWDNLSKNLLEEHVDAIILACTDLSVLFQKPSPFTIIDSSASLAKAIVYKQIKEKKNF